MKIVLADIEEEALKQTEEELKQAGSHVLSVIVDVSKLHDIENLAKKTIDEFGEVHLLCNNAGVGAGCFLWECDIHDWNWVMGVNLWGVIYGIRTFVPIMLQQDNECHIVNTASVAGILPGEPANGIYSITKHGVVALSESLRAAFDYLKCKIGISVLCPGIVKTRITNCERNRPQEFRGINYISSQERLIQKHPEIEKYVDNYIKAFEKGTSPDQAGDIVFESIKRKIFYIFTETGFSWKKLMEARFNSIIKDFEQIDTLLKKM
ncbi:MAG: SDR family NAD(P)-dependent oxidoreductase, partial [Promethearchaeota archaeon]